MYSVAVMVVGTDFEDEVEDEEDEDDEVDE